MDISARALGHTPVLLDEVVSGLAVRRGGVYIDATVGSGGHAARILELSAPDGRLLALDADPDAVTVARERLAEFGERVVVVHSNYVHLAEVAQAHGFVPCNGILFDLGVSSRQLAPDAARSFSFDAETLDMRLDPAQVETAADLVNHLPESELADIIYRWGDEPFSRRIARAIVMHRPITSAQHLADVIEQAVGRRGRIHPATKTFQALRIEVNRELTNLEQALPQAIGLLAPAGRLVVIAFHSGEDRIVKDLMRRESKDCICPPHMPCVCSHRATIRLITRHVIVPTADEVRRNPRSRSARLRVAERI